MPVRALPILYQHPTYLRDVPQAVDDEAQGLVRAAHAAQHVHLNVGWRGFRVGHGAARLVHLGEEPRGWFDTQAWTRHRYRLDNAAQAGQHCTTRNGLGWGRVGGLGCKWKVVDAASLRRNPQTNRQGGGVEFTLAVQARAAPVASI